MDAMALTLFHLSQSQYHLAEIKRGLCDHGEYNVSDGVEVVNSDIMPPVVGATNPSDTVDVIRDASDASAGPEPSPSTSTASSTLSISSPRCDVKPDHNSDAMASHSPVPAPADNVTSSQNTAELTTAEHAAAVISQGHITIDPKLAIFTVIGTNEPRVVRLFPTTTCSCPTKANCYHILAAWTAIGVISNSKKRTINLTQLCKNTRKHADKTCGRKRPRLEDVEVVAADDHDDDETAAIHDAINVNQPSDAGNNSEAAARETSAGISDNVQTVRSDMCHWCCAAQPPAGKCKRRIIINWVCCDQ